MASFKADSYYDAHCDAVDCDTSDEESIEDDVPANMQRMRVDWMIEHQEALWELYDRFSKDGEKLFGGAFYQNGTINEFCKLIFKYTVPGAAN